MLLPHPNLLPCDGIVHDHGAVLPEADALALMAELLDTLDWRHDALLIFGRRIVTQRKTAWHGDRPYAYTYSHQTRRALPWTPALLRAKALVEAASGEQFNCCLLNLYHSGAEGMGWHSDNEDTLIPGAPIASLSLGAERKFVLRHNASGQKVSVMLPNGGLLLMRGETQVHWQHSLPKALRVSGMRVNLTFRVMREDLDTDNRGEKWRTLESGLEKSPFDP